MSKPTAERKREWNVRARRKRKIASIGSECDASFPIVKGVPMPPRVRRAVILHWPLAYMEPGDMFVVPYALARRVSSNLGAYYKGHPGALFSTRDIENGVGVWCVTNAGLVDSGVAVDPRSMNRHQDAPPANLVAAPADPDAWCGQPIISPLALAQRARRINFGMDMKADI